MAHSIDRWNDFMRSAWHAFDPDAESTAEMARFACMVRLNIVTLQHTREIAEIRVTAVNFERKLWQVRPSHVLPLAPIALALIRKAFSLRRTHDCEWIFQDHDRRVTTLHPLCCQFRQRLQIPRDDNARIKNIRFCGRMLLGAPPLHLSLESIGNILGHTDCLTYRLAQDTPPELIEMDDKIRTLTIWEKHVCGIGAGVPSAPGSAPSTPWTSTVH